MGHHYENKSFREQFSKQFKNQTSNLTKSCSRFIGVKKMKLLIDALNEPFLKISDSKIVLGGIALMIVMALIFCIIV